MTTKKISQNSDAVIAKVPVKADMKKTPKAASVTTDKKPTAKVLPAKKATTKKPASTKAPIPHTSSEANIYIEFSGRQFNTGEIVTAIKEQHKKTNSSSIDTLAIYIKPEDCVAYYVINDQVEGKHILL